MEFVKFEINLLPVLRKKEYRKSQIGSNIFPSTKAMIPPIIQFIKFSLLKISFSFEDFLLNFITSNVNNSCIFLNYNIVVCFFH